MEMKPIYKSVLKSLALTAAIFAFAILFNKTLELLAKLSNVYSMGFLFLALFIGFFLYYHKLSK